MKLNNQYYTFQQSETFISEITGAITDSDIVINKKKIEYVNLPCAFDIETSSFYTDNGEKRACCYLWQFGFNGNVILGRNLRVEFPALIKRLATELVLGTNRRVLCYVHNLSYEFQWIRKMFTWQETMSNKIRQPFKALSNLGFEFRCSYILSSYKLEKVADNLRQHNIKKLTEKMDYTKIRHSETTLTIDEISYAVNDVLIVMAYISEEIDAAGGNIFDIPLTNTGRVRKYCRKHSDTYKKKIRYLRLNADSYTAAKKAFQGGFTHANSKYVGTTLGSVGSYDFTSSYPYVMVSEKFPMSSPQLIPIKTKEQFNTALKVKCCIFQITFIDIQSIGNDNFISAARCEYIEGAVTDNGRVYSAKKLTTTITELDYQIITATYKFANFNLGYFYICKKEYLPLQFVQAILKLYSDKTTLKGVEGKETEYLSSKGMLNSCYGMCVTDIVRDEYSYDSGENNWLTEKPELAEKIYDYNNDSNRFLFYLWGVYVTAYARYNLITNIIKLGKDYVYADTDSIKFLNVEKNQHIFEEYNRRVLEKLHSVATERNIDFELFQPKTIKGFSKLLGVFDFEGVYNQFKTLGAKRYIYTDNGRVHLTIAGVNKKTGIKAFLPAEFQDMSVEELSKVSIPKSIADNAFNLFNFGMTFDTKACGKLTHSYLDDEFSGAISDYLGKVSEYHELSAIHLEPTTYQLTISNDYETFLNDVEGVEVTYV